MLSHFSKLNSLYLDHNEITDIKVLNELKWLGTINLKHNNITDLSPLSELKELRYTFLQNNPITKLDVLINMANLDSSTKKQFAPYWKLYISKNGIAPKDLEEAKKSLEAAGVKLTIED